SGHVQATVVASIAFIINTATGYVTTCSVLIDWLGNPSGHCINERVYAVVASYTQAAAPNANSVVLVNNSTGEITQCGGLVSGANPLGTCVRIGGIPTTSLSGRVAVNIVGNIAFITDAGTGAVANCSVFINTSGNPSGHCINE